MQICNPWIFMPCEVTISASNDNKEYKELTKIVHEVVKDDALTFKHFGWEGETQARYIRYQAKSSCEGGWLFTDEIVIK
jgi:hexosaminidase